jgi:uncharacterized protein YbbK (DUF523 family)
MHREYHRPRVGVSACLLGEPVRYNGGHKRHRWLVDVLGHDVEWVPVCPEVEIGLGTPRATMDLVRLPDGAIRLLTTSARMDLTDRMRSFAVERIEALATLALSGYVLKADSPSCGLSEVPVVGGGATGRGLFAEALVSRMPALPVADERELDDLERRAVFVARVQAYHAKMRP